ncbi:MAG: DUF5916 domain-containing protein [Gemmatimonadota bacterium]
MPKIDAERRCRPLRPRFAAVALLLLSILWTHTVTGQELRDGPGGEPPLEIPQIDGPIAIDGVPDEPAWSDAVAVQGVMYLPDFGAEPSQPSDFLLAHDGEYFYFACRAYESDPDLIRITTLAQDVSGYTTDTCGIRFDTFNDEENAVLFYVTPANGRSDWTFANDASGPPNMDWSTFWDSEATLTEYGWAAEMRVPFSSLGFQVEDGRVVMGFALGRSIVRNNEMIVHPAIPPNWGPASITKPSQMRKMILRGVEAERPVHLTPYLLTGGGHAHLLTQAGDAYLRDDDRVFELGGDLRYGLTRNLNLDLTLNTDFAQAEADAQQVNLTRFSLFFPEQRRFFQERAAIFEFPLGSNERLFHSRRIGLVGGEPVTIYGGGRLVGRVGDWDLGLLNMQTAGVDSEIPGGDGLPSENMAVLRLRRRVLNQFSYLGGILTSRVGVDGSYNVLYGNDAVVRLFGQDYLTFNWAQSFEDGAGALTGSGLVEAVDFFDRSLARVHWQRRGTDGLVYSADVTRAGDTFEPGMGFLRRRDYLSGRSTLGYGWRPGEGAALNRYSLAAEGEFFQRNADRSIESAGFGVQSQLETRAGHSFTMRVARSYEDLGSAFALAEDAVIHAGSYWFTEASVNYNPPLGGIVRPSVSISGGSFYDGRRISGSLSPNWAASRHLRLGGAYELDHIDFESRGQSFTSHIARLRTEMTFTTRMSASAFVQYSSAGDLVDSNLRFHYNPADGNDLYIVWNETLNSDRRALAPIAPLSQGRTVLVKYAHTFTVGF